MNGARTFDASVWPISDAAPEFTRLQKGKDERTWGVSIRSKGLQQPPKKTNEAILIKNQCNAS